MNIVTLSSLPPGSVCQLHTLEYYGSMRRRLQDLGFLPGAELFCAFRAPSGSPLAVVCKKTMIALRKEDCEKIKVIPCA